MAFLTTHEAFGCPSFVRVEQADEVDSTAFAHHKYQVYLHQHNQWEKHGQPIAFQKGPLKTEDGAPVPPNGLTNEALLAIVLDRLEGFQIGKFACVENQHAITHLREALLWLHSRTVDRTKRNVEGTNKV